MDNASIHKPPDARRHCRVVGGTRVFVPPYSPDFNLPIEGAFSDTKRWLRRHRSAAAGHDDITTADVQQAWDTAGAVSVAAVLGRFRRAGYRVAGY
jgi:transposase